MMKNTNTCKVSGDGRTSFYFGTELARERKMKSA
jgi:hypothetical protein